MQTREPSQSIAVAEKRARHRTGSVAECDRHRESAPTHFLPLSPHLMERLERALADLLPFPACLNFWGCDRLCINTHLLATTAPLTLTIHHPGVLRSLILSQDVLVLIEAYHHGLLDLEGDLSAMLPFVQARSQNKLDVSRQLRAWVEAVKLPHAPVSLHSPPYEGQTGSHSCDRDQAFLQHHYDVGNDFYQLWLDPKLVYSCAYFVEPSMSLEAAQEAKLDLICRKLQLRPDETLLDIGCGWGALLRWAAAHYRVQGVSITLSQEQFEVNQQRLADAGLRDQLEVQLLDYRQLPDEPTFDKIVSVGMIERVGLRRYSTSFRRALMALKPNGLFLNHSIASQENWNPQGLGERLINRYIFPGGELATLSTTLSAAEAVGWEVVDVDAWRPHYPETLRHWLRNLNAMSDRAIALIGKRKFQIWRSCLLGSALGFQHNLMGIYQTLLRRRADAQWVLPMTRAQWLSH